MQALPHDGRPALAERTHGVPVSTGGTESAVASGAVAVCADAATRVCVNDVFEDILTRCSSHSTVYAHAPYLHTSKTVKNGISSLDYGLQVHSKKTWSDTDE